MFKLWIINLDGNPRCLIVVPVGIRHVFDIVFVINEVSQYQKRAFQAMRVGNICDFHDFWARAIWANIEY